MPKLTLTPQEARRLAVARQRLEAPRPNPTKADLLDTIRQITCLQLDPINTVARTQLLVPFSRLGRYNPADLAALLWEDRALFEYWAHAASIVLAEDYPFFRPLMDGWSSSGGVRGQRYQAYIAANRSFRESILDELATRGPLFADEFASQPNVVWPHVSRWGGGKDIGNLLDYLWARGFVTVTGRQGNGYGLRKQWGLLEHQLGDRVRMPIPDRAQLTRLAAERALLALGAARLPDIRRYFTRAQYPDLPNIVRGLVAGGVIQPVEVRDDDGAWRGDWYLHNELLPELERLRRGVWRPQTVLLSPFDNLIADRARTERLFDFNYRVEIYTPAAKRRYGYYVMPILHGERLIGRVDPRMDRKANRLIVNAVHLEPGVRRDGETRPAVEGAIESLAAFLSADGIDYPAGTE